MDCNNIIILQRNSIIIHIRGARKNKFSFFSEVRYLVQVLIPGTVPGINIILYRNGTCTYNTRYLYRYRYGFDVPPVCSVILTVDKKKIK